MEAKVFIPKSAKSLAKFVAKDEFRPFMSYVLLNAVRGFIAATDGYVLRKIDVSVEGNTEGMHNVLIDPKHIAKVAGKSINVHIDVCNEVQRITLTCDGTDYVTEYREILYPNVLTAIPSRDGYNDITLSKEAMDALKNFCKMNGNFNVMFFRVDGTKMYVYCKDEDFGRLSSVCLNLDGNTGVNGTFAIDPGKLATCLDGSNGIMSVRDAGKVFLFGGEADVTMAMSKYPYGADVSCEHHAQAGNTFAEDMKGVVSQLREVAMEAWDYILSTHEKLVPGTYDANELTKKKPECGMIDYRCYDVVTVEYGCIKVQCTRPDIFYVLAQYEKVAKCDKTKFVVPGEVAKKERVNVLLNDDGKVLEKTLTITELAKNMYTYKYKLRGYGERVKVIFKIAGVYFEASDTNVFYVEKEDFVSRSKQIYDNARNIMQKYAERGIMFYQEVAKRIGEAKEAETVNVSVESENKHVKHISEIVETCRLHDEVTGEETDEYKYYKWLTCAHCGTYRTIADMALAEALAWIYEAAYRKGKGHIIAMNNEGVLIETSYGENTMQRVAPAHTDAINTPTVQRTTTVPKPRHRANLPANMAYNETNIYPGVSSPRENVYLCAKTRKRWERQRLKLRERTRVAGKRKYTCPLQE